MAKKRRLGVSLRKAINDKCRECICDSTAYGSCAQQIEACTSFECPLWMVRPLRNTTPASWTPWSDKLIDSVAASLDVPRLEIEEWCESPLDIPPTVEVRMEENRILEEEDSPI